MRDAIKLRTFSKVGITTKVVLKITALISLGLLCFTVQAQSPPDMPLPACEIIDGVETGACLDTDDDVAGSASGSVSEGTTLQITTVPNNGICIMHEGFTSALTWSPSPCFASVQSPTVSTCGVIDLFDGEKFKEMPCSDAFYDETVSFSGSLFSVEDNEGNRCGDSGNFQTYVYGGPANVAGARWSEYGPASLSCNLSFNGPRPNALFGPTWVKVSVGVGIAETGDERRPGRSATTEFYVPIDGDLRDDIVDVGVFSSHTTNYDESAARYNATLRVNLENFGNEPEDNVNLIAQIPPQFHIESVSHSSCSASTAITSFFTGGEINCSNISLAEADDILDRNLEFIDIELRVINASEIQDLGKGDIEFAISGVSEDQNPSNDVSRETIRINLNSSGEQSDTQLELDAIAQFYDYSASSGLLRNLGCNIYTEDIYSQLSTLNEANPALFENISFGRITTGSQIATSGEALDFDNTSTNKDTVDSQIASGVFNLFDDQQSTGHSGVVVYLKGTDYRTTGVVIHGTSTWSPFDIFDDTKQGTQNFGEHRSLFDELNPLEMGTQHHGNYYRTPIQKFPNSSKATGLLGCGFEGLYSDNRNEFTRDVPECVGESASGVQPSTTGQCDVSSESTLLRTESPVDIYAVNGNGDSIRTVGSTLLMDEYFDGKIFAWADPHEDGSYSWLIALPDSGYDVELIGNAEGDYIFTHVAFDENGEPFFDETRSLTSPDLVDTFEVGDIAEGPSNVANGSSSSSGGGCTIGSSDRADPLLLILTLLSLLGIYRKRLIPYS